MKLIPMTDFVLDKGIIHYTKLSEGGFYNIVNNYAKFLKQPLTLGMFIPCDEEGNILEEPKESDYNLGDIHAGYYKEDLIKYKKAKEHVLFEGFYYQSNFSEKQDKLYEYVRNKHPHVFSFEQIKNNTVESLLTGYKKEFLITLTKTAIKQIEL